jgi:hypothetical protein
VSCRSKYSGLTFLQGKRTLFDVFCFARRVRFSVYFGGRDVYLNIGAQFITLRYLNFLTSRLLLPVIRPTRVLEINKTGRINNKLRSSTVIKQVIQLIDKPPHHPESNCTAQCAIKSIKSLVRSEKNLNGCFPTNV